MALASFELSVPKLANEKRELNKQTVFWFLPTLAKVIHVLASYGCRSKTLNAKEVIYEIIISLTETGRTSQN